MYQLTIQNNVYNFKTKDEGLSALLSRWYYEQFPYRWHRNDGGYDVIHEDWLGDYNYRRHTLLPRLEKEFDESGSVILDGLCLTYVD